MLQYIYIYIYIHTHIHTHTHTPVKTCCQLLFLAVEQRYVLQEEYAAHTTVDITMHTIVGTNLSRAAIEKENRDINYVTRSKTDAKTGATSQCP